MFSPTRLALLAASAVPMIWGVGMFWNGKQAVDRERVSGKPRPVTLDQLLVNPPKKGGEWVTITDGGAVLPRAILMAMRSNQENTPFFLYAPILPTHIAAQDDHYRTGRSPVPDFSIVLRSENKQHRVLFEQMEKLESLDTRTADAWLAQNRASLLVRPPFTGTLVRRQQEPYKGAMHPGSGYASDGWVLLENERPPFAENAQVTLGLALLMGVPTVWIFGLLITGKLAPPDDELPATSATPTSAETPGRTIPIPASSVMPSAMPVPSERMNSAPDIPGKRGR